MTRLKTMADVVGGNPVKPGGGHCLAWLAALVLVAGCTSPRLSDSAIEPRMVTKPYVADLLFTRQEVVERQWVDLTGSKIALVDFSVENITNRLPLAIAKYGNREAAVCWYVDVYQCLTPADPQEPFLKLLCHEVRPGVLTKLEVEHRMGKVYLTFHRDFLIPGTNKTRRSMYSYIYEKDGTLLQPMEEIYSEVSAQ